MASLISKIKRCDGEAPQGHVEVSGTQMSDLRVKSEIESLTEVVKSLHLVKLYELIWYLSLHSETFASVISFFFFFWTNLVSCQQLLVLPVCVSLHVGGKNCQAQ